VAPDGANVEQNRFSGGARGFESLRAPFVPVDGLVRGGTEIGARGIFQAIFGLGHHEPERIGDIQARTSGGEMQVARRLNCDCPGARPRSLGFHNRIS
jgi:hypothetical protein